jgi:hypothetical protein
MTEQNTVGTRVEDRVARPGGVSWQPGHLMPWTLASLCSLVAACWPVLRIREITAW